MGHPRRGERLLDLDLDRRKWARVSAQEGHELAVTIELATETLKGLMPAASPATTSESIQKLVADYYNLKVSQLKSKTNSHQISFPRQVAMYLCKRLTSSSLQEIGRRHGGKHHSTVIHAVQKIDTKRKDDDEFDKLVEHFTQSLK